jgi:SM-20-related protein
MVRARVPDPEFFARFGIFSRRFLDDATCTELRTEMRTASGSPATVAPTDEEVDEGYRRTKMADVSDRTREKIRAHLLSLMPELSGYFDVPLSEVQRPQFLVYRRGDFFRRHIDSAEDDSAAQAVRARRVSTVVFLNGEGQEADEGSYGGGALTFYGLLGDDPPARDVGLPLTGATGLLVAFRSDAIHSVSPVTHGERYTIVSWFS